MPPASSEAAETAGEAAPPEAHPARSERAASRARAFLHFIIVVLHHSPRGIPRGPRRAETGAGPAFHSRAVDCNSIAQKKERDVKKL